MSELRRPKEITLRDLDGQEHTYRIGRWPAIPGLRIVAMLPGNVASFREKFPHLETLALDMLRFVEVDKFGPDGEVHTIRLTSSALIDNHVPDVETLIMLGIASVNHNTSLFRDGGQRILDSLATWATGFLQTFTQTLTASSE